jgi:hypothetical protein
VASRRGHVLLHRLWVFATLQEDLSLDEHRHLISCESCRGALRVCMQAENFGVVLKELGGENESQEDQNPAESN